MEKLTPPIRDPRVKLIAALDVIEKFTQQNIYQPINDLFICSKKKSLITKIIEFARCFVSAAFNEEVRKSLEHTRNKMEKEVWKAIDDVHRYHPLVLKKENDEAKALASRAFESIRQFNQFVGKSDKNWRRRLLSFLIKRSCLSIAKPKKIEVNLMHEASKAMQETSLFSEQIALMGSGHSAGQKEEDVFRMKAFSLLKGQPALFPSIQKALSSLKESPIYAFASPTEGLRGVPANSVVLLEQQFSPFPGKTVVLRGAFIRRTDSITPSVPILDSFRLSMEYNQTGFPHPAQNNGWALSEFLIPLQPLRPDQMKLSAQLLDRRNQLSVNLLEKGIYFEKAKYIYWNKEACTVGHKDEYLLLQKRLSQSLIRASNLDDFGQSEGIASFFYWLSQQSSFYTILSDSYNQINESFINIPYKKLVNAWLDQGNRNLLSNEPKVCFLAARLILEVARKEVKDSLLINEGLHPQIRSYIINMGKIIGAASDRLILQHLSEVMEFPPPFFTEFEKKLQVASFRQLNSFADECMAEEKKMTFERIRNSILCDIDHFEQRYVQSAIVDELEQYYITRFNQDEKEEEF